MFNVAGLAKYKPYYEVYWLKGSQENSAEFGEDELEDAEELYKFKKSNGNWDYVELRMVLECSVKE